MDNLMIPVLDGKAVAMAAHVGAAAPTHGLPRNPYADPAVGAVFTSAPQPLRGRMVAAYTKAYDKATTVAEAAA